MAWVYMVQATPVDSISNADHAGHSRVDTWNYHSVIGKLNYLAKNPWPDISMAVYQCAQYCSAPKAIHELAVKQISHYLLTMHTQGLIVMWMQILPDNGTRTTLN